jgi:hypothetical protein
MIAAACRAVLSSFWKNANPMLHKPIRLPAMKPTFLCASLLALISAFASAQPADTVSSVQRVGVMITSESDPEHFIFRWDVSEEHFDGSSATMVAQGGFEKGEPITGLHYLRPKLTVSSAPFSPADVKLLDAQFHGAATGNYYLFKTVEGQLFFLPKAGETAVVRTDYKLKNGTAVTVWARK